MSEQKEIKHETLLAWMVCALAALFYCYEFFLRVAPSVMVQDMMSAYGVGASSFALMSAAYYYIYTPMQLPVGVLMDRFGPRKLLTLAVFLCAVGAVLIAADLNLYLAAFCRALMGFGSAFAFVGVLKLAVHWLPPSRLAMVSGLATALGMFGAIGGDTVLNKMVQVTGWRYSWVVAGVFGLILTAIVWLVIRDNPHHRHGKQYMNRETRTWGQAWAYLVSISKNPQFWLNGLIGCLLFLPLTVFGDLWGVTFLEEGYHFSSDTAGWAVSMLFLGVAISGPFMGWFSDRLKRRKIILIGGSIASAIFFCILLYVPDLSKLSIFALLFLIGASVAAEVVVFAVGCEISNPKAAGTAVAGTNFLVMLGGMIFEPLAGVILEKVWDGTLVKGVPYFSFSHFQVALSVLPIALIASCFLTLLIKETYCKQQFVEHPVRSAKEDAGTSAREARRDKKEEYTTHS